MTRSKEVKGMMTDMADNAEDLSVKEDSEKGPETKKLETLQVKEVERLKLRAEESGTVKSVEAEVTLAEVLEWLVADPEVLNVLILILITSDGKSLRHQMERDFFGNFPIKGLCYSVAIVTHIQCQFSEQLIQMNTSRHLQAAHPTLQMISKHWGLTSLLEGPKA